MPLSVCKQKSPGSFLAKIPLGVKWHKLGWYAVKLNYQLKFLHKYIRLQILTKYSALTKEKVT